MTSFRIFKSHHDNILRLIYRRLGVKAPIYASVLTPKIQGSHLKKCGPVVKNRNNVHVCSSGVSFADFGQVATICKIFPELGLRRQNNKTFIEVNFKVVFPARYGFQVVSICRLTQAEN